MILKVLTILPIFIPICIGEIQPKTPNSEHSNNAFSSVTFHRQDVPLNYQYNAYHPQAPSSSGEHKTHGYQQKQIQNPVSFRSLQYAPLIKPGELLLHNMKFSKAHSHKPESLLDPTQVTWTEPHTTNNIKRPLEPRVEEFPTASPAVENLQNNRGNSALRLDYIPGHNIEVLRSLNRYPAHNAVYRSYTDRNPTSAEKQNKYYYLNQYYHNPNQRENDHYTTSFKANVDSTKRTSAKVTAPSTTTSSSTTTAVHTTQKPYKIPYEYESPKQYYIPKPITYIVEKPLSAVRPPYTKMHSLLLNVARTYSLAAMSPHKNQLIGPNSSSLAMNHKYHPLLNVPGSSKLNLPSSDHKTLLFPVQKNVHFGVQ